MNKIINYTLILLFFILLSCDYKPILNYKNLQFSIQVEKTSGDEKINSIISDKLNNIKGDEKEYFVSISSKKEKNIISKDSKGDPSIYEVIINVDYSVQRDEKILIKKNISRKTTYNNITDKFELESYEKSIIDNLSSNITERIIFSISEINE